MLGLGRGNQWHWTAVGKHPAAADYIQVQGGASVFGAVADWATKGYAAVRDKRGQSDDPRSYRFWLRGVQKGGVIYGVLRDSSDRIGRPFPLLIMGQGVLKGWEKQWPWLPERLAKSWESIESAAARAYADVQGLTEALATITCPGPAADPTAFGHSDDDRHRSDKLLVECGSQIRTFGRAFIPLTQIDGLDPVQLAMKRHRQLEQCCVAIPTAVFFGGTVRQSGMMVVAKPLTIDDFVALWQV